MTEDGYMSTDFTEIRRDDEGEEVHARESANEQRKKFATDKVDDVGWMDGLESDKRGTGTRRRWKRAARVANDLCLCMHRGSGLVYD